MKLTPPFDTLISAAIPIYTLLPLPLQRRRLTTSRSERFLGGYGYGHSQGDNVNDGSEFGEEDVWSVVDDCGEGDEETGNNSLGDWSASATAESNWSLGIRGRRRIPRGGRHVGGLSLAFEDSSNVMASSRIIHQFRGHDEAAAVSPRAHHMATSAPVNVPDWSKIYRVKSVESMQESSEEGLDDGELEMIPPHEYLARSKKSGGASVFEGVGRTLKGLDMRRVRDAVWRQTGFDG